MGSASKTKSSFGKDMGLIHEAVITAREAGWSKQEWATLAHDRKIVQLVGMMLRGEASLPKEFTTVDCDATPSLLNGHWMAKEHLKLGQLKIDPKKVGFWRLTGQEKGISGFRLLEKLKAENVPILNANVLDFFVRHQHVFEEALGSMSLDNIHVAIFWGTIYHFEGNERVRGLHKQAGRWMETSLPLGGMFAGRDLAVTYGQRINSTT